MPTAELVPLVVAVLIVLVLVGTGVEVARRRSRGGATLGSSTSPDLGAVPAPPRPAPVPAPTPRPERHLQLRPLPAEARSRYLTAWEGVQGRYADSPVLALSAADALLTRLLADRGLPTDDGRSPDVVLSPQHAQVLDAFRAGHAIEQRNSTQRTDAGEVRQGMQHFTQVFAALVSEGEPYPQHERTFAHREIR